MKLINEIATKIESGLRDIKVDHLLFLRSDYIIRSLESNG